MKVNQSLSIARDPKEVAHNIKLLEIVLLVEIPIALRLPEATGAHVQATFAPLQADKRGQVLVIRRDVLLTLLDDLLGCCINQALHLSWLVLLVGEVASHDVVNGIFDACLDVGEGTDVFVLVGGDLRRFFVRCLVVVCVLDHLCSFIYINACFGRWFVKLLIIFFYLLLEKMNCIK